MIHVRPAARGRVPNWLGLPGALSMPLCQEMKRVLATEGDRHWLTESAAKELDALRASYEGVLDGDGVEERGDEVTWHTFAGGAVNRLLAAGLESQTGKHWVPGNLSVRCKDATAIEAREAIRGLRGLDWDRLAAAAARGMARGVVSKFQPCLPEEAEDALLAERLLDVEGTARWLGAPTGGAPG